VFLLLVSLLTPTFASDSDHKVRLGSPVVFSFLLMQLEIEHCVRRSVICMVFAIEFFFMDLFVYGLLGSSSFYSL